MQLTIDQPCHSCGASIILREDERLVHCEYCDVSNFKIWQNLPRYTLASRLPSHIPADDVYYVPYLRFKGCIYYVKSSRVYHKLVDTTRIGFPGQSLPVSLGLRPQAMSVQPLTEQHLGRFVAQTIPAKTIFAEATKISELFENKRSGPVEHRAFIGETVSRVYLPVYFYQDMLYDGVNHLKIGLGNLREALEQQRTSFEKSWEPKFISTVCPNCGDLMGATSEGLTLHCFNCEKHWFENNGTLVQLDYRIVKPKQRVSEYIPFWRIEPKQSHPLLKTLANFLEITNQPVLINTQHRESQLAFYVPAFKIKPDLFLLLAKNMTMLQLKFSQYEQLPVNRFYPVTMPHGEAFEALKSILVASAVSKKRVMEILPEVKFIAKKIQMVYLPFDDAGHDYIEQHTGVAISAAALRFGRQL